MTCILRKPVCKKENEFALLDPSALISKRMPSSSIEAANNKIAKLQFKLDAHMHLLTCISTILSIKRKLTCIACLLAFTSSVQRSTEIMLRAYSQACIIMLDES